MRAVIFQALSALVLTLCLWTTTVQAFPKYIVDAVNLKPTNYQKWAHYHWAWVKNSDGNSANVTALMKGYQEHHIPLGAINIDSTWATQFNNFEVDTTRFPDFPGLVKDLHDNGLKVILWATSMVNVENPDYQTGLEKGYFIKNSHGQVRPLEWWHGSGALLDYSNPEAVTWWHSLMDRVLDAGVDGFKCDGTDPYIMEYSLTGGAYGYNNQVITYPEYAHMYYRDFLYYTREKRSASKTNQDAGLIMSRPVDCLADKVSKVCNPFSPKDVMYSGWVGDDDGTFEGLVGCVRKVIYSAWTGYANFGCDVGGYRDRGQDRVYFLRSAQLNAFLPLMENGGGGEHRPWMYDDEVVRIYRTFAVQHHRMATYLHNNGANAVDSRQSAIHPVDDQTIVIPDSIHVVYPQPTTYSYRLGADIVVHPVLHDKEADHDAAMVQMTFPESSDVNNNSTVWLDWWFPNDMKRAYKAGQKAMRAVSLESYPVYVREGAFLPLHDVSIQSVADDKRIESVDMNRILFTWFHPSTSVSKASPVTYDMRESITTGTGVRATAYFSSNDVLVGEVSSTANSAGFAIVGIAKPSDVQFESWKNARCMHVYEVEQKTLKAHCENMIGGMRVTVSGVNLEVEK